jgi:FkbM family methyltransferase
MDRRDVRRATEACRVIGATPRVSEPPPLRIRFRVRATSARPLNVAAFLATKLGVLLKRRCGKFGFNALRRVTGDALAQQPLEAVWADSRLRFPALDPYWSEGFDRGCYEPEVCSLLWHVRGEPFDFIDGGANIGYFSALVSGAPFGSHRAVAVEASVRTCAWLEGNRDRNGRRFRAVHAAMYRTAGEFLAFDESSEHAARHLAGPGLGTGLVVTTTVDEIVSRLLPDARTLIVKLDLEGAEPDALAGAARTRRECDCLFIVEDHGSDHEHRSARACFAEGLHLWLLGTDGVVTPVPDLAAVAQAKVRRGAGYNFVACAPESPLARRIGLTPRTARLAPVAAGGSSPRVQGDA